MVSKDMTEELRAQLEDHELLVIRTSEGRELEVADVGYEAAIDAIVVWVDA